MKNKPVKNVGGRPPTDKDKRVAKITFYVTEDDRSYLDEVVKACGARSRSSLCAGIIERLCKGRFQGLTFMQLGFLFAQVPEVGPLLNFGVRPCPPRIGDAGEPTEADIVPFMAGINKQIRKENTK